MTNELAKLDKATRMLAEAKTLDDIKNIVNIAEAAKAYARAAKLGLEAYNHAAEVKVRAERKAGEMLKQLERGKRGPKELNSGSESNSEYAEVLEEHKIPTTTANRWQLLADMPAQVFEQTVKELQGERPISTTAVAEAVRKEQKQKQREEALANIPEPERRSGLKLDSISVCSIYDLDLPEESVDMIFTDPPYHDEHLDLFAALARLAQRVLKPGAYLMTYCGKMFLPDIVASLGARLEYVWQYCVYQPDSNHKIQKHHIFQAWRPILCYRKPGPAIERAWQPDAMRATRDKEFHEWQQQIEPPLKYIEAYTQPGAVVLDPFIGGGTTAAACKEIKRHYVGFDIDPEAVKTSMLRLGDGRE